MSRLARPAIVCAAAVALAVALAVPARPADAQRPPTPAPGAAGAPGATVAAAAAGAPRCRWPSPPTVLLREGDRLYQRWEAPADALRDGWEPAELPALQAFRERIAAELDATDAPALLRRQIAYWRTREAPDDRREGENGRMVLEGAVGRVRPVGCLEGLLLDLQASRFPMVGRPTEYQALVLRRAAPGEEARLRVYFAASGDPWPPKLEPVMDAVARDLRDGWTAHAHVHNHPFYLEQRATDVAGAVAPSLTDVQFYRFLQRTLGLEAAWVTNGFDTAEIPARDFGRLHARE